MGTLSRESPRRRRAAWSTAAAPRPLSGLWRRAAWGAVVLLGVCPVRPALASGSAELDMIEETQLEEAARSFGAVSMRSLLDEWHGVVWLKPAICDCRIWARSIVARYRRGETRGALVLMPGRTDTDYCQYLIGHADIMCALRGRVRFTGKSGGAPFPSVVFYLGDNVSGFHAAFLPFANGFLTTKQHAAQWAGPATRWTDPTYRPSYRRHKLPNENGPVL